MWDANMERIYCGKRGQKVLRELIAALLALPERRLVADVIQKPETGEVCAIGALAKYRGIDPGEFEDSDDGTIELGEKLGLGFMLSWQIGAENDLHCPRLKLQSKHVMLDVPVEVSSWYGDGRPSYQEVVSVSDYLRGYSPEERWQHIYNWAASKIRWSLPVPQVKA
jgi:hypothetical protein